MSVHCRLCEEAAAPGLWADERCRVILAGEAHYPGFCRVVWREHRREMTDLGDADRQHLLHVVCVVESVLRELVQPDKINLASLGNQVPHLHWHVIPRFADDAHFPDTVWAAPRRGGVAHPVDVSALARRLHERLTPT
jgi:diadenosine tetraphosphate (Ap4A) HIT family hydrolase